MININKISTYLLLFFLTTFVVDAPLRYLLNILEADILLYLRDLLLLVLVFLYVFEFKNSSVFTNKTYVVSLLILGFSSLVGFFFVENIFQVVFTIKLYLPFFLAMGMYKTIYEHIDIVNKYFRLLFLISMVGLVSNYFFEFPWNDLTINVAGVEVETNVNWTTAGVIRPSGFARRSFDLAGQIIFLGIFVSTYVSKEIFSKILWVITGIGIILTTTKGIIFSYLIISLVQIIKSTGFGRRLRIMDKIPSMLLTFMVAFPVITTVFKIQLNVESLISRILFRSFEDRVESIWPSVFELLFKDGSIIFGRGIGGFGTSQAKFELSQYVSPDNLFLYLFGVFGIFSLLLVCYVLIKLLNIKSWRGTEKKMFYEYFIVIFSYGIFSTAIENPFFIFFVGLAFSFLLLHNHNAIDKYKFKLKGMS